MEEVKNELNDELYTKIETEKLMKEKKKKNAFIIAFLSVMFALAVVIICLASIPLNMKPSFLKSTFNANVTVNGTSTGEMTPIVAGESNADYNEFMNILNDAFSQTYFSALFNGSLSSANPIESKEKFTNFENDLGEKSYVYFAFAEKQNIKDKNGKIYSSTKNLNAVPFTFDEAYLVLSEEEGIHEASFYVVVRYLDEDGKELKNFEGQYVIEIPVKADTSKIFDHYNPNSDNE